VSGGLLALLDDVAALAKVTAASLDDVAGQAMKAGSKAAGVVIDDAAVTPAYVTGLDASRELSIVARIAVGSLRNKLLFLLPAALLLGAFAPWAIMPLLMLGGAYLSYEAAEKVVHALRPDDGHAAAERAVSEAARVRGAIQTDLILSAEIMAITLETVSESPSWTQALVLGGVGSVLTVVVYGAVALIVKADDIGLVLVVSRNGLVRALGRSLVAGVPVLLGVLSVVGTAAMAWVGGGIILHGLDALGWRQPAEFVHHLAAASGPGEWFVTAGMSGLLGLLIGTILIPLGWAVARTRR
jgi:predicted DNA repair protein MutK